MFTKSVHAAIIAVSPGLNRQSLSFTGPNFGVENLKPLSTLLHAILALLYVSDMSLLRKSAVSSNGASPLAKIAVGLVRLDYSAEIVQHTDLCLVRARERTVLRVRDRVTDRVWPCIPDRAISKPIAD